jgi:DNA gyrase subunit A
LIFTELPYLVGPERVIEKIKDGVNNKKLSGISDVTDLTDRTHGLRLVVGIKTGFSPEAVLEQLYRYTPLEDGFSINNVALVGGGPQTLGLRELLQVYVDHRIEVVTRRSSFRLARRRERLHLVEGMLIAIVDIDEVIQVIRASNDTDQARTRLIEVFDLSQLQAEYILELRLRRLTRFSRIELETERDKLKAEIAELETLLASEGLIRKQVSVELAEVAERFGTPRRTLLTEARPSIATASAKRQSAQLEVADVPCRIYLSATGRALRVDTIERADGEEVTSNGRVRRRTKHDAILSTLDTTSRAEIGAVTSLGRLVKFSPVDLPVVPTNSLQMGAGVKIVDYLALPNKAERVLALVSLESTDSIALGTRQGVVKRVSPGDWPNKPDFEVIGLKPKDEVIGAVQAPESAELVFVSSGAQLLHFPASVVRPQGRPAGGMAGMNLPADSHIVFFGAVDPSDEISVATVAVSSATIPGTDPGRVKVSSFSEYPAKGRATGGVRTHTFLKGEDMLSLAWVGTSPVMAIGPDGSARTLPEIPAKRDASGTAIDNIIGFFGREITI